MRVQWIRALGASAAVVLFAVSTAVAATPGFNAVAMRDLKPCPGLRPNCVSSLSARDDQRHRVESFKLQEDGVGVAYRIDTEDAWARVKEVIGAIPRVKIIESSATAIKAEVRSSWFGFPDDLELSLSPVARRINIRSASRRFPFDFGVNRRRVEDLRAKLAAAGVIQ